MIKNICCSFRVWFLEPTPGPSQPSVISTQGAPTPLVLVGNYTHIHILTRRHTYPHTIFFKSPNKLNSSSQIIITEEIWDSSKVVAGTFRSLPDVVM